MKYLIYAILSNYSINHNSAFIEQGNQRLLVFLFTEKDYENNRGTPSLTSSNNILFFSFFLENVQTVGSWVQFSWTYVAIIPK